MDFKAMEKRTVLGRGAEDALVTPKESSGVDVVDDNRRRSN